MAREQLLRDPPLDVHQKGVLLRFRLCDRTVLEILNLDLGGILSNNLASNRTYIFVK